MKEKVQRLGASVGDRVRKLLFKEVAFKTSLKEVAM